MSTVRLTDDHIAALRELPLDGLSPELTHPFKSDKRRVRNMAPLLPRVFLSYSHDSAEHKERILRFAQRLRKDGIDARSISTSEGGRQAVGPAGC